MDMTMGNLIYWHRNQVIIRYRWQAKQASNTTETANPIQFITGLIANALADLNVSLEILKTISLISPSVHGTPSAVNIDLLHFASIVPSQQPAMGTIQGSGSGGTTTMDTADKTLTVIERLNTNDALKNGLGESGFSLDLMPHWFWTSCSDISHGCPVSPPVPVSNSGEAGQWHITFQQLADASLLERTGEGVTVFVLDSMPSQHQIESAAKAAPHNKLLREMTTGMGSAPRSEALPPAIGLNYSYDAEIPDPASSATTGKDIYGRLVGFPMADHGIAIAGIIRDLAPGAQIECVRVLNDYGVGNVYTLARALTDIAIRMESGNLARKPVVINLSLLVLPPGDSMPDGVTGDILKSSRDLLYSTMQKLADRGVVFTASTGNDSDPRDTNMNPLEVHFGPRYPAALAYDLPPVTSMIPVGAVNRKGEVAIYSNHPGYLGIATYAGDLPQPDPWLPSAASHVLTRVVEPVDALCCVYTNSMFPALSVNDQHAVLPGSPSEYPMYEASTTWAYWSGTSFATPIISSLAARILQSQDPESIDVRQAIRDAATQKATWGRIGNEKEDISGPVIMATQTWQPDKAPTTS